MEDRESHAELVAGYAMHASPQFCIILCPDVFITQK